MFDFGQNSTKLRWAVLEEGQSPVLQIASGSFLIGHIWKTISVLQLWKCDKDLTEMNIRDGENTKPCSNCNSSKVFYKLRDSNQKLMCSNCGHIVDINVVKNTPSYQQFNNMDEEDDG